MNKPLKALMNSGDPSTVIPFPSPNEIAAPQLLPEVSEIDDQLLQLLKLRADANREDSPAASKELLKSLALKSKEYGLDSSFVVRVFREIIGRGSKAGQDRVQLASRHYRPQDSIVEVRGVKIGGPDLVIIAGPCAVESHEQILSCARVAKAHGANILRGGCFKARTSPYSFQGLGWKGLEYLKEAGEKYDLPIITEVLSHDDVEAVAEHADILQIGARNMQNFVLLKAVGRSDCPVMLKRGISSSIDELLLAAEYVLSQGNSKLILCERGIRTFETSTRNTLDLSAIPVLKQKTHLPLIVDPSHAAGQRDLVPPLALAAKAVGAHGLMIEFHPCPDDALSDGPQALSTDQFDQLMKALRA